MNKFLLVLVTIASAIAATFAHAPYQLWPLMLLGIAVLWLVSARRALAAGALGFIWGFTYFFLHLDWVHFAAGIYLAQVLLAAVLALFFAATAVIWSWLHRARLPLIVRLMAATAVAVAVEQLRGAWPLGGMPWGKTAFAVVDSPLVRLAPWGSTALVGAATFFIALCLASLFAEIRRREFSTAVLAGSVGVILIFAPLALPVGNKPTGNITLGIVQGNGPTDPGPDRALRVTESHVSASRELDLTGLDLVLWPESASDRDIRQDARALELVQAAQDAAQVPILLGTQKYFDGVRHNDYVVFKAGGVTDSYTKQHPVPFGEYVPWRETARKVTSAVDMISTDMVAGREPAYVTVGNWQIATPICFEVAYDQIVAEAVLAGAQLIVVPTNNASFGDSNEPYQQFAMTKFRAIEHGRSAVQVSTTGTSGAVMPTGLVRYQTELFVADAHTVTLPLAQDTTIAARTAGVREIIVYFLGVAGLLAALLRMPRRAAQRKPAGAGITQQGQPRR
ncbi:MAG: apolipoprotein N-acyltransferase [Trueperella sp.]|nr:apolipoprotein N-acyltransferase [Trueperella sp.]